MCKVGESMFKVEESVFKVGKNIVEARDSMCMVGGEYI